MSFEEPILCHHNYVSEERHFGEDVVATRKGAIRARFGEARHHSGGPWAPNRTS